MHSIVYNFFFAVAIVVVVAKLDVRLAWVECAREWILCGGEVIGYTATSTCGDGSKKEKKNIPRNELFSLRFRAFLATLLLPWTTYNHTHTQNECELINERSGHRNDTYTKQIEMFIARFTPLIPFPRAFHPMAGQVVVFTGLKTIYLGISRARTLGNKLIANFHQFLWRIVHTRHCDSHINRFVLTQSTSFSLSAVTADTKEWATTNRTTTKNRF